jgi:3-phosphoshikimate 1-carboxyvinyltransferase
VSGRSAAAPDLVEVQVPGDKSITHRALILAALAQGTSILEGLLPAADAQRTAAALRQLGISVPVLPDDGTPIAVAGHGLRGLREPAEPIDCGNSGTTARLLLGALAGSRLTTTLTGDDSLRSRPMRRVTEPLAQAGAAFEELGEPDRLPIRITGGGLQPIEYSSPHASAQIKSALLLAGLTAGTTVHFTEPILSRDHTERMLRAMGANLVVHHRPGMPPRVELYPPEFLDPLRLAVPGDFSSAAFFLAFGLLTPRGGVRLTRVGVNPTRTGLLEVLRRMGALVDEYAPCEVCDEPVATLIATPTRLRGTEVGAAEIPALIDEIPILAILAARAEGETRITGAAELRVKESDRIAALVGNLRAIGVDVQELPDGMVIHGSDAPLAGRIRCFDDHRIAMAFGVLAALPGHEIEIDDPECTRVSFPDFWDRLRTAAEAFDL